jgi:hypothetical protein
MSKSIFIFFLFFCSLYSFSQKVLPNTEKQTLEIICNEIELEKVETISNKKETVAESDYFLKENLCEFLFLKISDLMNESMLKKKNAIV